MHHRRSTIVTGLAGLALFVAACGGAGASVDPDGVVPPEASIAIPSIDIPSIDPSALAGLPSFDPTALLQNLEGIDSYRIQMSNDGEVGYSAVVVTKPTLSRDITMGTGDDASHLVIIGDEAWIEEDGAFQPLPPALAGPMLAAFDPMLLMGGFTQAGAWSGAADEGVEDRNGVQARHFHIDDATFLGGVAGVPTGASVDAWISEDGGYLVGLEIVNAEGEGIVIDVTGINDPANVVERPS